MPAPEVSLTGDELLAAINNAMIAFHNRYCHRKPTATKTTMLGGDLIACVMSGIYTDVEKTLIEIQQQTIAKKSATRFRTPRRTSSSTPSKTSPGATGWRSSQTTTSTPTSNCSFSPPTRPTPHT